MLYMSVKFSTAPTALMYTGLPGMVSVYSVPSILITSGHTYWPLGCAYTVPLQGLIMPLRPNTGDPCIHDLRAEEPYPRMLCLNAASPFRIFFTSEGGAFDETQSPSAIIRPKIP